MKIIRLYYKEKYLIFMLYNYIFIIKFYFYRKVNKIYEKII